LAHNTGLYLFSQEGVLMALSAIQTRLFKAASVSLLLAFCGATTHLLPLKLAIVGWVS
jgi:hypothetical protein